MTRQNDNEFYFALAAPKGHQYFTLIFVLIKGAGRRRYNVARKILTKTITITIIKVATLKILKTRYSTNKRQSRAEAKIEYYKVTQI